MKIKLRALTLLPCLLMLSACANASPAAESTAMPAPTVIAEPAATAEPTPTPEPETTPATVRYREAGAVYAILEAGEKLKVTAEDGEWYACELDGVSVFVEKRFIRLEQARETEPKTHYAKGGALPYNDVYLRGEPLAALAQNTELKVLETLGDCVLAELENGARVFISADEVSESRIPDYYPSAGGGSAPSAGADGGEILLTGFEVRAAKPCIVLLAEAVALTPQSGTVLADGVEAYLRLLGYGDEVEVLKAAEGKAELLIDGHVAVVPAEALRMRGEQEYAAWEGYIQSALRPSGDRRMRGELGELTRNAKVKVLEELEGAYLIETESGLAYVPTESVGKEEAAPQEYYGGEAAVEWTSPVL